MVYNNDFDAITLHQYHGNASGNIYNKVVYAF